MRMRLAHRIVVLAGCLLATAAARAAAAGPAPGTGTPPALAAGAIAVLDLDRAAKELGYSAALDKSLGDCRAQLQTEVTQFRKRYEGQIETVVHGMVPKGVKPSEKFTLSPQQSQEVTRDVAAERQQVAQLGQKADQLYAAYRVEWIRHYREALEPVVQQVARDRRAIVVLVKSDAVMYAEASIDITNAVIDAARAKPPEVAPVPFPRLEAPLDLTLPSASTTQPATP